MSGLKLYYHPQAPHSRAVTIMMDVLELDFEDNFTDFFKGETKTPQYLAMNVQHTVPFLVDGSFKLTESVAIMAYLIEKYGKNKKHLLGSDDLQTRTRILERSLFSGGVFFNAFYHCAAPRILDKQPDFKPDKLERLKETLGFLTAFLKETGFVAGTKEVSMADFHCLAMYTTMTSTGNHVVEWSQYPEIAEWAEKVKKAIPNYEKANGKGAKMFGEFFTENTGLKV